MSKKALIFGEGDAIDLLLYKKLIASKVYDEIVILSINYPDSPELRELTRTISFSQLHQEWNFIRCDHLYYTAISTINPYKKTEDKFKTELENFYQFAKIAKHNGVKTFVYKSRSGSSPNALKYKNKVFGQIEEAIKDLKFENIHILKPYIILGKSDIIGSAMIFQRGLLRLFNFMMIGFLKNIKGMPIENLLSAMIHFANKEKKGIFIHSNKEIHELFPKK